MKISRLHRAEFIQLYGIHCSPVPKLGDREGAYATFCRILPGENTIRHAHFESEFFYIIRGFGLMTIEGEVERVQEGDLIRIPSFSRHFLKNSGTDELVFLSVYSEDSEIPNLPVSTVITCAPPTPNGPLHLGHISGPYLASDILTRYLRLRSLNVRNFCGTDDHQNYIYEQAQAPSIPPEIFRRQMRSSIQTGFTRMHIEFDEFIEPKTDAIYQDNVLNFVRRAVVSNVIEKEAVEFPYCISCDRTLVDAAIIGYCPCCREMSHGVCENCGVVVPPYDLQNTTCTRCNNPTSKKLVTVYTFELNKYLPAIKNNLLRLALSPRLREMIERISQMKQFKVLLTHPDEINYGIRLPEINQVIHVWFEMAAYYEQFSLNSQFWIHCFGFDNSFYYLLFIPALLRAMHPKTKLPDAIITNNFLQLEGRKFSTSRGHAVWIDEFTGNVDHLRLYLSLNRPAELPANFSMEDFQQFSLNIEMQLMKLNQRAEVAAQHEQFGIHPQKLIDCNRSTRNMEGYLSSTNLDLRRASRELILLIDLAIQSEGTGYNEKLILRTLAVLMSPFMPHESERLLNSLKITPHVWIRDWSSTYAAT